MYRRDRPSGEHQQAETTPAGPGLKSSAQLPSLSVLAGQTGLATGTVRRAIDVLAAEHLVRTVPGRGTFVIRPRR
jgi:DNA-binding GntR family transcriptional regulator